jgi:hypothetical protein
VLFCFKDKPKTYAEYVEKSLDYGFALGFDGVPIFENIVDTPAVIKNSPRNPEIDMRALKMAGNALYRVSDRPLDLGFALSGPLSSAYSSNHNLLLELISNPRKARAQLRSQNKCLGDVMKNIEELVDFFILIEPLSSNSVISPAHFYEFCTPLYSALSERCSKPIVLHAPGKALNNMEYIIKSGIKGLQPLDMDDLYEITRQSRGLCLIGNISTRAIKEGLEAPMRNQVGGCLSIMRKSKQPSVLHSNFWIHPNTPVENVKLLMEIIKQHG